MSSVFQTTIFTDIATQFPNVFIEFKKKKFASLL